MTADTYDRAQMTMELMRDEGVRLKPYKDTVGKLTIGVGRNLDDVGISESEAAAMLTNDMIRVEMELDDRLPWWRTLDPVRQRVLLNMAFNMGTDGLITFHNMLAAVQAAQWQAATVAMRASRWATQVGSRATRLVVMMQTGVDSAVAVKPATATGGWNGEPC